MAEKRGGVRTPREFEGRVSGRKIKVGDIWFRSGLGWVEKTEGGIKVHKRKPGTNTPSAQRKRSRARYQALTKGVPKRR